MMRVIYLLALLLVSAPGAAAYPTSSNLIPTADMLEAGSLRLEFENDGAPGLFGPEADSYLLLQYAPHSRLEVGLDLYSVAADNDLLFNAKWLVAGEKERRPALAVGVLEVGKGYPVTQYLVATKDTGDGLRLHAGGAACDGDRALLLGAEQTLGDSDYLLADYATWPAGHVSLGIYHEWRSGVGLNLACAWPNDPEAPVLLLLNVSRTVPLR
jgi:hypothetical protein